MNLSRLTDRIDPAAARVAARTAIFMPACFALATSFLGGRATPFAAFGSFIVLAMVTFAGRPGPRAIAWLCLVLAGCALITVGTLLSHFAIVAGVAAAGIISFSIFFLGVVNPYVAAARNGAILLLALPLMIEAPSSAIDDRLAGWLLAAGICIPATYLLWREPWTGELRQHSARVCGALAELVKDPHREELRRQAFERVSVLRRRFLSTPHRPTGATGVSAAIAGLVEELGWLYALMTVPAARTGTDRDRARRLRGAASDLLEACSEALTGGKGDLPVEPVKARLKDVVEQSASELAESGNRDVETVAAQLEHEFRLRKIAYGATNVAELVSVATERERAPGLLGQVWHWISIRSRRQVRETGRLLSEHAAVRSSWFQNSLRGAVAIALAVLAADLLSVQNAFWVVLGTLSILRNNALGTRGSIVHALGGTLVGILIGSALVNLIGDSRTLLWVALPVSVLFAAYAPRAISFAAGQAGFALLVMVLYNLIEPVGWEVAIIRIQDVAVGCAVSLLVGLLIWPRGSADLIRSSLAESIRAGAALVRLRALGVLAGRAGQKDTAWQDSVAASDRLDAVLRQFLDESSDQEIDREALLTLGAAGLRLRRTSTGIGRIPAEPWFEVPGPDSSPRLNRLIDEVTAWYGQLGEAIARDQPPPAPLEVDPAIVRELISMLSDGAGTGDAPGAGIGRLWLFENLAYLSELSHRYNQRVRELFADRHAIESRVGRSEPQVG